MELKPADIAKECGVSVGTVRNWCKDYAESLSAGANPSDGNRILDELDLEKCQYIAGLRKEGMSKAQIILRLRETTFGHVDTTKPIEKATEYLQTPQKSHQDAPALIVASEYLLSIERRFEALEASVSEDRHRHREPVYYMAVGAIGALVFVVLMLLLFLVRHAL